MLKFKKMLKSLARDERGATIVEYGVALVIVTTIAAATLTGIGGDVNTQFTEADQLFD